MPRKTKKKESDPTREMLDAILAALKDIIILTCARSGLTMSQARAITGMDNNSVSRVWKHVKKTEK